MRTVLRLATVLVLVSALAAAVATGATGARAANGVIAVFPLTNAGGKVVGVAWLQHKGNRLTGWIVATGLAKGGHAMHIHGPGTCKKDRAGNGADVVVPLKDMKADGKGVALFRVNMAAPGMTQNYLKSGFYLNVHKMASTAGVGPGIVCGDVKRT